MDITSGLECIKMLIRISSGSEARINPPLMIFKNENRNYPICNVWDTLQCVEYRTDPNG